MVMSTYIQYLPPASWIAFILQVRWFLNNILTKGKFFLNTLLHVVKC